MKKFEFQNNEITIEMLGLTLKADAAEAECEVSAAHKLISDFGAKVMSGKAEKKEIEGVMQEALVKIDNAFGEGTSAELFKNRTVSYHDVCDVICYISSACNEFEANKKELYESFRGNREERRGGPNLVK